MTNHSIWEEILMNVPYTPVVEKWWQHCNKAYHRIRIIKWKANNTVLGKLLTLLSKLALYVQISGLAIHCLLQATLSPPWSTKKYIVSFVKKTVGKKLLLLIIRWVNTCISSWVLNMRKLNSESHWLLLNSQGTAMSKRNLRQIHLQ